VHRTVSPAFDNSFDNTHRRALSDGRQIVCFELLVGRGLERSSEPLKLVRLPIPPLPRGGNSQYKRSLCRQQPACPRTRRGRIELPSSTRLL